MVGVVVQGSQAENWMTKTATTTINNTVRTKAAMFCAAFRESNRGEGMRFESTAVASESRFVLCSLKSADEEAEEAVRLRCCPKG